MNENFPLSPDDPRLTAYALGELDGDERAFIEAAVQRDPALQAIVADLRAFSGELGAVLSTETDAPSQTAGDAIGAKSDAPLAPVVPISDVGDRETVGRRRRTRPYLLYVITSAAAACFAVMVALREDRPLAAKAVAKNSDKAPAIITGASTAAEVGEAPASDEEKRRYVELNFSAPPPVPEEPSRVRGLEAASGAIGAEEQTVAAPWSAATPPPLPPTLTFKSPAPVGSAVTYGNAGGQFLDADQQTLAAGELMKAPAGRTRSNADAPFSPVANESYGLRIDNAFTAVAAEPLSTFSIDVDTASYANVRRFLAAGQRPPADAVRVEELINYFPYRYAPPADTVRTRNPDETISRPPFAAHLEVASAPWAPDHRLVRIGLKGRELSTAERAPANLVFLLDVSGSMDSPKKLPLVKESLRLLVEKLRPDDRVAIVTYAGASGLALPSTPAARRREILDALDTLAPGGSTNGAMGIQLAYDIAKANAAPGGINRVILCTDGDFNVGVTNQGDLVRLIEEKAKADVFLTVLGFGMGNLKDSTLELLADKGNGSYAYVDTRREAEKIFVEQAEGTLATIAKDVKIQIEFNPTQVQAYRLVGYENRLLKKEDFNNDAVDAGEIGAGHTVTALYEVVPAGAQWAAAGTVDALRYQRPESRAQSPEVGGRKSEEMAGKTADAASGEMFTLKIRYKLPASAQSEKMEVALVDTGAAFTAASADFKFVSAVAGWGMLLRDSAAKGTTTFDSVLAWAESGLGDDVGGYRAEFLQLVRRSKELTL